MQILRSALVVVGLTCAVTSSAHASVPACIKWWSQTVATATGYNHVVGLQNDCDKPAACTVSTDVAPDPIQVTVSPKQKTELTTFRGSPSYTFKAKVDCKLE
jgi:hypothetical protein